MSIARAVLLVLAGASPLAAQDAVPLRFAPAADETVHRVFQTHTRVTLTGPEAQARETAHLGGMTQVVVAREAGETAVHLALDSLRSRARAAGGPWQERSMASAEHPWVQVRFDRRLQRLAMPVGADRPEAELLLQLVTGLPGLVLPERPVRAGERWEQLLAVPLAVAPEDVPRGLAPPSVPVAVAFTVDSLVRRAQDTLAYLAVDGVVRDDGTDEALAIGGEVTGMLVWSTGWHGIVSAATRTRVELRPRAPQPSSGRRLVIETTVRSSVRP